MELCWYLYIHAYLHLSMRENSTRPLLHLLHYADIDVDVDVNMNVMNSNRPTRMSNVRAFCVE